MSKLTEEEWIILTNSFWSRSTHDRSPEELRHWWRKMSEVLSGLIQENVPAKAVLVRLNDIVSDLALGIIPGPVSGVVAKGRKPPTTSEVRHIRIAVTYQYASKHKLVPGLIDPHPNKTIAEAYGLKSTRTVQKWVQKYEPLEITEKIAANMRRAGQSYQIANARTHKTIRERANRGERK